MCCTVYDVVEVQFVSIPVDGGVFQMPPGPVGSSDGAIVANCIRSRPVSEVGRLTVVEVTIQVDDCIPFERIHVSKEGLCN